MESIEDDILNRGMDGGSFSTSATRGLDSNLCSGRDFANRTGMPPGRSQTDPIRIRALGEINQNVQRIHTQESVVGISRGQPVGNGRGSTAAWTRASEPGSRTSPGNVDENRRYENRRHLTREQVRAMEELGSCPICTDPTTGSVVTRCGHRFCGHCIVEWMERNNTCPVCRKAVADDELVNDPDFEQLATIVRDDSQSATSDWRKSETFARLCNCSLCSNILDGAALTICGHRFCAHCIRHSLEDRNRCPNCHQPLRDTDLICDPDFDALTALLKTQIERRTNDSQGTSSNIGTRINESQGTSSNIGTRNNVNLGTSTNASSNGGSRNNDNLRTSTNANSNAAARNSPETGGIRFYSFVVVFFLFRMFYF